MTNLTLRDRRRQQAEKDLARLEAQRDKTLDQLTRIAAKLKATRRSIERYQRTPKLVAPRTAPVTVEPPPPQPASSAVATPAPAVGNLDIPDFLRRSPLSPEGKAIEAEQEERRKAKARGRIAKLKAKQSGDMKKMPLSGKEALAAIKG